MDYPQKVAAARKIQLASGVQIVPQSGHGAALRALAFHPQRENLLAALDDSACVLIWHVEFGHVLCIAPLPEGRYDAVRWVSDMSLAVRQLPEDPQQPPLWWVYTVDHIGRWRPSAETPPIWPTPEPKPYATVHPELGPCVLFPGGRWQRLQIARRPLGLFADPLGRYALDWLPNGVGVYSATDGRLMGRFEVTQGQVTAVALDPQGAWGVQITDTGDMVCFDPMRPERLRKLAKLQQVAKCVAISPSGKLIAVGSSDGHVVVINPDSGQRILRTGRAPFGFTQEIVLREQIGYAGLRGETLTAHLEEHAQLIPTMPMPALTSAIAPFSQSSILASLNNGLVVELDLRKRSVTTLFDHGERALLRLAVASDGAVLGVTHDGLISFHNNKLARYSLAGLDPTTISHIAVAPACAYAAIALHDGRVHIRRLAVPRTAAPDTSAPIEVPCHARAMTFIPYRNSVALAVIDHNLVLWRLNPRKGDLRRIAMLEAPPGCLPLSHALSATCDRDGSLRVLIATHNRHRALLLVDAATGSASFMGAWVIVGQQILALYDNSGCWLRDTEISTIQMVHDFYPYSVEDWLRRPDLRGLDTIPTVTARRSRWVEK